MLSVSTVQKPEWQPYQIHRKQYNIMVKKFNYRSDKDLSSFESRKSFISELYKMGIINIGNKDTFYKLLNNPSLYYTKFSIPKKHSKERRRITAPQKELKLIQDLISSLISNQLKKNNYNFGNYVQAYQKQKGIFTNAQIHRNKKYVIHLDLKNFFDFIHFGRVSGYFMHNNKFNLKPSMAFFFANLCCYEGKLAQGSPSSPIISNIIGEILDKKILLICKKYKLTYSRYADDIIFSTNDKKTVYEKKLSFFNELQKTVKESGFSINWEKLIIMGKGVRHTVTGLSNNKRVSSKKEFYMLTRAMSNELYVNNHFIVNNKYEYNGYTRKNLNKAINVLEGRYSFINDIEQKNRKLYLSHNGGAEYSAITPPDFNDKHTIKKENYEKNYSLSGKQLSYTKFIFYKFFLSGDQTHIFTEGKTDPRYIKSALKALNYPNDLKIKSFQEQQDNNTQFSNLFNLSRGGDSLKNIIDIYNMQNYPRKNPSQKHELIEYYKYFTKRMSSLRPTIMLLDYELTYTKPLKNIINDISNAQYTFLNNKYKNHIFHKKYLGSKKEKKLQNKLRKKLQKHLEKTLEKKGFYNVFGNLYIVVTTDLNGFKQNRAIEQYFPKSFLENVYGDNSSYFIDNKPTNFKNKKAISKDVFSKYVEKITDKKSIFKNFNILIEIFNNVQNDYINKLIKEINNRNFFYTIQDNKNICYNILDSKKLRQKLNENPKLKEEFLSKYRDLFF